MEDKGRLPLFDGNNFDNWKFRVRILLEEKECVENLQEMPATFLPNATDTIQQKQEKERNVANWLKSDRKCKSIITQLVADSHLEYIKDKKTAHEMWNSLINNFERKGIANQLLLRKKLLTMKLNAEKDQMENHFTEFDKIVRELKATGATLEETDIVCHLLLTMPSEYNMVVTALETISPENLTLSFVKARLKDEENKKKTTKSKPDTQSVAFSTPHGRFGNEKQTSGKKNAKKFPYKCHNCGKIGHKRVDCKVKTPMDHSKKTANVANTEEEVYSFSALNEEKDVNLNWCLDSGASEHLVRNENGLQNIRKLEKVIRIKVAKSGELLTAKKIGDLKVISVVDDKRYDISIKDCLIVPNLDFNLLSVRKLEINGFSVVFNGGLGKVIKNNKVLAQAVRNNKLYELHFERETEYGKISKEIDDFDLWHNRLGHISVSNLQKLKDIVKGINISMENKSEMKGEMCEICISGKQTKAAHDQERVRARAPLELVHSDLFGPIKESYDNKKYVLTFIDDYTHFTVAYALQQKSETFKYFKIYESMATAHFNRKLSRFRCDNGREYISQDMKNHFEKQGIQFEFTIRYTPQQNGVAERMNRTITEKARCMLLNSKLPKNLWTEAVFAAVYLINRSPTKAVKNKVPAELWFGKKPDLRKLRVFGCIGFLKIPNELIQDKFATRSIKVRMVGYCPNGYRLYNMEENKIYTGRDVVFNEWKFEFETKTTFINDTDTDEEKEEEETDKFEENIEEEQEEVVEEEEEGKETERRKKRLTKPPQYLKDYEVYFAYCTLINENNEPETYTEAIKDKNWQEAINKELNTLEKLQTWEESVLPKRKTSIDTKWVFKMKQDGTQKARLVAKGFQLKDEMWSVQYAPVARMATIRILIAHAVQKNWMLQQLDVPSAFLNGELTSEIYINPPEGYKTSEGKVLKLKRALYGLKESPKCWNNTFNEKMIENNFKRFQHDFCLYFKDDLYILIYVDDIIITGKESKIIQTIQMLKEGFNAKELGELRRFIGMEIRRDQETLSIKQTHMIDKTLSMFNMKDCKGIKTPMEAGFQINEEDKVIDVPYRKLIGCLMYLATISRPDIMFSTSFLSRVLDKPSENTWKAAKRILRYLKETRNRGLVFKKSSEELICYTDADWAGDKLDRKSVSGSIVFYGQKPVSWFSQKQVRSVINRGSRVYRSSSIGSRISVLERTIKGLKHRK